MKYLIIVCLLLSACAKENANQSAPVVTCDSLNAKYADKSENELLAGASNYEESALTLADSEYASNLYLNYASELRKAADCK